MLGKIPEEAEADMRLVHSKSFPILLHALKKMKNKLGHALVFFIFYGDLLVGRKNSVYFWVFF